MSTFLWEGQNSVPGTPAKESILNFQLGILEKQKEVLLSKKQSTNEFNTTLLAINSDDLDDAKQLIKKFWRDFEHILDKPKKNALYCLAINFFKLDKN